MTCEATSLGAASADRGRYDVELDLGLKDPARDDRDTHWQQIDLSFQVWKQPSEPFETTFGVSDRADAIEVTLSPRVAPGTADSDPVRFDVKFVAPNGTTIEAERVEVQNRGFVDLSGDRRDRYGGDEDYALGRGGQQFIYRVEAPSAGSWTLRVMPHNTVGFSYEIVRTESDD